MTKKRQNDYSLPDAYFRANKFLQQMQILEQHIPPSSKQLKKFQHKCVSEGVLCNHNIHLTSLSLVNCLLFRETLEIDLQEDSCISLL